MKVFQGDLGWRFVSIPPSDNLKRIIILIYSRKVFNESDFLFRKIKAPSGVKVAKKTEFCRLTLP